MSKHTCATCPAWAPPPEPELPDAPEVKLGVCHRDPAMSDAEPDHWCMQHPELAEKMRPVRRPPGS